MVYKYKKKTNGGDTPAPEFAAAAAEMQNGTSLRKAARNHNIDKMTLKRYINKLKSNESSSMGYSSHKKVFIEKMGSDLVTQIIDLSERFHGLTSEKVKELAYEFAMVNKINILDSWKTNKKAGKDWLLPFMAEYKLSVRQPEATSLGRATAFNAHNVSLFYSNFSDVMSRHQFPPNRIFNIDETGCSTVQNHAKVIARQGTHQVGSVTSGERGRTVTMVGGINAAGGTIPPMFIFSLSRITSHLETIVGANAPPMSKCSCFPTEWTTEELFLSYLHHFKDYIQCSTENKCLLILETTLRIYPCKVVNLPRKMELFSSQFHHTLPVNSSR